MESVRGFSYAKYSPLCLLLSSAHYSLHRAVSRTPDVVATLVFSIFMSVRCVLTRRGISRRNFPEGFSERAGSRRRSSEESFSKKTDEKQWIMNGTSEDELNFYGNALERHKPPELQLSFNIFQFQGSPTTAHEV